MAGKEGRAWGLGGTRAPRSGLSLWPSPRPGEQCVSPKTKGLGLNGGPSPADGISVAMMTFASSHKQEQNDDELGLMLGAGSNSMLRADRKQ